ncbi:MAG: c-type cytochrome biogenesis protein CcsB [Chloroflexi bacterium]|nr:c-type cytochrome biogenesis protein CcsB [Chloroflexota bacterium]
MSLYLFSAGFLTLLCATILYLWHTASRRDDVGRYATVTAWGGVLFLGSSLLMRMIAAGRGPFSNMYEFSTAFAFGVVVAYVAVEQRYHTRSLGTLVLPVALGLMAYASTLPSTIEPLVPALQNNLLLTVHVTVAILAYGTFAVAFGAAVLYLYQSHVGASWLPMAEVLDDMGYHAVMAGFPAMALVLILGAVWADVAWGRYWGWDPKETASLVTWLLYGGYLHARAVRGWRGDRSAVLLILGFAAVMFTYFGNLFFGGLHSYAGLQ